MTQVCFFDIIFLDFFFIFDIRLLGLELYDLFLLFFLWIVSVVYRESCFSEFNPIYLKLSSFEYYFFFLKKFIQARGIAWVTCLVSSTLKNLGIVMTLTLLSLWFFFQFSLFFFFHFSLFILFFKILFLYFFNNSTGFLWISKSTESS